jgi:large subunit ribosomal protein L28
MGRFPGRSTTMSQRCDVCGKGPMTGNNVSHSKRHTRRRFMPNLQSTHILKAGRVIKAKVCTRCVRTQAKAAR